MEIAGVLADLEASGLAKVIRNSISAFPLIEAVHVIAITLVFGTIAVVDLRLLGVASGHRPYTRLAPEILKWTWITFVLAVATGSLMFITSADRYFHNTPFRVKMLLMLAAGVNMAVFQFLTSTSVHLWDDKRRAPTLGRMGAILSLTLWIGVIAMGRLIGFTKVDPAPPPANVNFDDFLDGGASGGPPSPPGATK